MSKKSFFQHSVIYWLGKMAARSSQIVFLPVYTAYLKPADYGELSVLGIVIDIVILILSFQLPTAIYRFWVETPQGKEKDNLLGGTMLITVIAPLILLLPIYIWVRFFADLIGIQSDPNLLRLVMLEIQLALIVGVIMSEMRVLDESRRYSLWEIGQQVFMGLFSVILIAGFGMGIWGMFCAQTGVFACITLWLLPSFIKRTGLRFSVNATFKMLRFALPLIPSAVAMAAIHSADRFFLQHMMGMAPTGLYSIGYKVGMLVSIIVTGPFLLIWEPRRFVIAKEDFSEIKYGQIFTLFFAITSTAALVISGFAKEIVELLTAEEYWPSYTIVPMIAWSYVFFGLSSVVNVGLYVKNRTTTILLLVIIVLGINFLGNFLLIPIYGIHGAALATMISFICLFLMNLFASMRCIAIAFEFGKIALFAVIALALWLLMNLSSTNNIVYSIIYKFSIIILFIAALFGFGFFSQLGLPDQIASLWKSVRKLS